MSNIFTAVCTVVRDAEKRFLPSGAAVANVTVANNIGFSDKQKTLFIRVAIWGVKAESGLIPLLVKGQQILISGELSQSEYKANDGSTKTSLELACNIIDLVGKRGAADSAQASKPKVQDNFGEYEPDIPFANTPMLFAKHHLI